ncbi:NmrA family protein [Ancylobacter novellus DSM 506]|uniref:NmrA family protein n=1 Tax=Ancylobacter novellus (strain ATCC 8093 / DSM 506 / JCM 20403 / CCM 1077 / IAM 12100 / NBRC 12443 / NCIMB 10456) TaxID=639283 RepID=D7A8G8_ANCN5|nr:SDR family oxidoreductase [Ancylobacter novellus]ADH88641.1 NmrA family protein [Ancylobacter novellus DSM 506]
MAGKILVLGATGTVGRPLVKALLAKGEKVKAASRTGQPVEGAEGVAFAFDRPETFDAAFDGVDRAYVLVPGGTVHPREMALPVVEAAAARKVKVVLQSVFGADADDSIPYRQLEIVLEKSGTPYVFLRPNWFTDNFLAFWKPGIDHTGAIAVPAGEGKSSFIDARDIAESAAAALTTDRFDNKAFNLTGPEALSYGEAAAVLTQATGRKIGYTPLDDDTFVAILSGAGVDPDYARFLASIFHPVREGWTAAVTTDVETLTGRKPRTVADWAKENAAALRA